MITCNYANLSIDELVLLGNKANEFWMENLISVRFETQAEADRFMEELGIPTSPVSVDEQHEDIADRMMLGLREKIVSELNNMKGHTIGAT